MVSFTDITKELINSLNHVVNDLQDKELIKQDTVNETEGLVDQAFKFRIYDNDGEYEASNKDATYLYKDKKEPTILMCIRPIGGVQDVTLADNLALYIISIELCANATQFDDIKTILDYFTLENRSRYAMIDSYDGSKLCKIEVGEYPVFDPFRKGPILENSYEDLEVFNAHLTVNVTDFLDTVVSNNYKLNIDGTDMKVNSLTWQRHYEQEYDTSQLKDESKSFPKISTSGFTINFALQDNLVSQNIFEAIITNNTFGKAYKINLNTMDNTSVLKDKLFVLVDGQVSMANGKIITLTASFVPAA